jgi:RecJ-like exonuclease
VNANACTNCGGAGVVDTWDGKAIATCATCNGSGTRQRGDRSGDRAALEAERVQSWLVVDELQEQRDEARRYAEMLRDRLLSQPSMRAGAGAEPVMDLPWEVVE